MRPKFINLTLRPELENFIQQEILAGNYASPEEAIEAALNLLQAKNATDLLAAELRGQIDIEAAQLDRGEGLDGESVLANLRAKLQAAREAR